MYCELTSFYSKDLCTLFIILELSGIAAGGLLQRAGAEAGGHNSVDNSFVCQYCVPHR